MKKEKINYLIMILLTLITCLIILEIGARAIYKGPEYLCTLYEKDDLVGAKPKPNTHKILDFYQFKQNITTNNLGFRDRNYEQKKENEYRILALGDSFVWGAVFDINETFVKVLEKKLPENYSVINLGIPGWGSYQALQTLKREGQELNPDEIIYFFYQNDVEDDLNAPSTTVNEKGCIISKNAVNKTSIKQYLKLHSRAYIYFGTILPYKNEIVRNILYKIRNQLVKLKIINQPTLQYKILLKEYNNEISTGWNKTLKNIKEMNKISISKKIPFTVVMIPMKFQVYDDWWEEYKQRNSINSEIYDFKKPGNILKKELEKENIKFLDITQDLKNNKTIKPIYYEGDAHFNTIGNKVVGEILHKKLFATIK